MGFQPKPIHKSHPKMLPSRLKSTTNTAPTPPLLTTNNPPSQLKSNTVDPRQLLNQVQETTRCSFNTTKGELLLDVHIQWAPIGAATFLSLVLSNFYDGAVFFRTVPGFVSQFGLNGDPTVQQKYSTITFQDDPPLTGSAFVSNTLGTVSFASHGPNTRSTQVFISLADNVQLDHMHFTPFAKLTDESLQVATQLYSGYGESPDQSLIQQSGNMYLLKEFPLLDQIIEAKIVV